MNQLAATIELENGVRLAIDEDSLPLLIGRDDSCQLRVGMNNVSRRHCELYRINDVLFLRDTSTNGTIVDNKKLKGGAVPIDAPTQVILSSSMMFTINPSPVGDVIRDRRFRLNRREYDRRQADHRSIACISQLERRADQTRRMQQRRRSL